MSEQLRLFDPTPKRKKPFRGGREIGIVDAEFIEGGNRRFPNLACMKLSSYHKSKGDNVTLVTDWDDSRNYDKTYVSKVFTDTKVPEYVYTDNDFRIGGTGFFFDKAPALADVIEHSKPDYELYTPYLERSTRTREFFDYSIGFTTRGCVRKCGFCVNKKYDHAFLHSPISEFHDESKPKICLLDDNVFAFKGWRRIFDELRDTGKPFKYKQGLDERMLDDEKCKILFSSKYDGDITFAYDSMNDRDLILDKLRLVRNYTGKVCKFYVLCGYDPSGKYDYLFWENDIVNTFIRINDLFAYGCIPYITRFEKYKDSPFYGMYVQLARWCNQPSFVKKKSFIEFIEMPGNFEGSAMRAFRYFMMKQSYMQEHLLNAKFEKWD